MQFETIVQIGVFCTALNFRDGIGFQRIDSAEGSKAIWKLRRLTRRPVVLSLHLGVLVRDRRPIGFSILIR